MSACAAGQNENPINIWSTSTNTWLWWPGKLTRSKNTVDPFINFDKTPPLGRLLRYGLVVEPQRRRLNGDKAQIQRQRVHFDLAREQAGEILQVSAVRRNAQRADDVLEEALHREDVQVEPVARDGILGAHVLVGEAVALRDARRANVQILQVGGNGRAESLTIAATLFRLWK